MSPWDLLPSSLDGLDIHTQLLGYFRLGQTSFFEGLNLLPAPGKLGTQPGFSTRPTQ